MYRTRSKDEYFIYIDRLYTLALKQLDFGSNSVLNRGNSEYNVANQRWEIPGTGFNLLAPVDVFIPNSYFIECKFSLGINQTTVIFSNWNTSKQTNYYVWYDSSDSLLKITYRSGISILTVPIQTVAVNTAYFLSLYITLENTYVYINGSEISFTSIALPQLFNLDFSFNRSVNNVNNAGSILYLEHFILKESRIKPLNYTPQDLSLQVENYQFNIEKNKARIASASYLKPDARIGDIYAPAAVSIAPIQLSLNPAVTSSVVSLGNTLTGDISTQSLTLSSNITATTMLTAQLSTSELALSIQASAVNNTPLDAQLSTKSLELTAISTVSTGVSASISTNSISIDSSARVLSPVAVSSALTTQTVEISANVNYILNTAVNGQLSTSAATVTSTVILESSLNNQAQLFLDTLTATYTNAEKARISEFFDAIESEAIYAKLDRLYIAIGKNSPDMRRCWKSRTLASERGDVNAFYSNSFYIRRVQSPTAGHISTGFAPNTPGASYQTNSASMFIGIKERFEDLFVSSHSISVIMGGYTTTGLNAISQIVYNAAGGGNTLAAINSQANSAVSNIITTDADVLASRSSDVDQRVVVNGTVGANNNISALTVNNSNPITIGDVQSAGSSDNIEAPSNIRFYYAGIGGNLTNAEFDYLVNEIKSLISDLDSLRTDEEINLVYQGPLDTNDVFYFIGTDQYRKAFKNPAVYGDVRVTSGNLFSGSDSPILTVGHGDVRAPGSYIYTAFGSPNPWFMYDLGPDYRLQLSSYAIQSRTDGFNGSFLRTWEVQGSNNATDWTTLDSRVNDTQQSFSGDWSHWNATSPTAGYFRYIRLLRTGLDSSSGDIIGLNFLKLYGQLRYKARTFGTVNVSQTFTYSSPGDSNGVFFWLGTDRGRSSSFGNPQLKGLLSVRASSRGNTSFAGAYVLTDRQVSQGINAVTTNTPNQFYIFDLGTYSLQMTSYSIKSNSSFWHPRSWTMQGSNDGITWDDLDVKVNDTTFTNINQWANWPISTTNSYRLFRFVNTGLNDSGNLHLALGQVEFYGHLTGTVVE